MKNILSVFVLVVACGRGEAQLHRVSPALQERITENKKWIAWDEFRAGYKFRLSSYEEQIKAMEAYKKTIDHPGIIQDIDKEIRATEQWIQKKREETLSSEIFWASVRSKDPIRSHKEWVEWRHFIQKRISEAETLIGRKAFMDLLATEQAKWTDESEACGRICQGLLKRFRPSDEALRQRFVAGLRQEGGLYATDMQILQKLEKDLELKKDLNEAADVIYEARERFAYYDKSASYERKGLHMFPRSFYPEEVLRACAGTARRSASFVAKDGTMIHKSLVDRGLSLSPNGKLLAALVHQDSYMMTLAVWSTGTGQQVAAIENRGIGGSDPLCWSPDSTRLLSTPWNGGGIEVHEASTGKKVFEFSDENFKYCSFTNFIWQGDHVGIMTTPGHWTSFRIEEGKAVRIMGEKQGLGTLILTCDEKGALLGGRHPVLVTAGKTQEIFAKENEALWAVQPKTDFRLWMTKGKSARLEKPGGMVEFMLPEETLWIPSFSADGKYVGFVHETGFSIHDADTGKVVAQRLDRTGLTRMSFHPNGDGTFTVAVSGPSGIEIRKLK